MIAEVADSQLRSTRENGIGEELRDNFLGREVDSYVNSPLGRSGPLEDGSG